MSYATELLNAARGGPEASQDALDYQQAKEDAEYEKPFRSIEEFTTGLFESISIGSLTPEEANEKFTLYIGYCRDEQLVRREREELERKLKGL